VVNARQNKGGNGRKSYEQKAPQKPLMTGRRLMGSVLCSGVEEGQFWQGFGFPVSFLEDIRLRREAKATGR
jgi:hypothetical protein